MRGMKRAAGCLLAGIWSWLGMLPLLGASAAAQDACPRIVSQAPYITETLAWLGREDCIVGVSSFDSRKDLPQTGGLLDPDHAAIAALRPEIVFLPEHVAPDKVPPLPEVWRGSEFTNVRVIRLFGFQSVQQIVDNVHTIASSLGLPDPEAHRARIRKLFDERFAALAAGNTTGGNIAVLTNCASEPAVIGRDSFINDALSRVGFSVTPEENTVVFAGGESVKKLSSYWDKNDIAAIVLLSDMIRPNCVRSVQSRQIPLYAVGTETLYSPSPRLLDDLDLVMDVIGRESAKVRGRN